MTVSILSAVAYKKNDKWYNPCFFGHLCIRTCHIPVILFTTRSAQQEHIEGLGMGAEFYLTKPFNRKILELNVRNLLATKERIIDSINHIIEDGRLLTTPEVNIQNAG